MKVYLLFPLISILILANCQQKENQDDITYTKELKKQKICYSNYSRYRYLYVDLESSSSLGEPAQRKSKSQICTPLG
mgnify:CR=1 FL=1